VKGETKGDCFFVNFWGGVWAKRESTVLKYSLLVWTFDRKIGFE